MWTRRELLKGTALRAAGGGYGTRIEPRWFDIEPEAVRLPRLDLAFHSYRVVQLSDRQMDGTARSRLRQRIDCWYPRMRERGGR